MTPTYQSGFAAPGRGVPKYPELWKGCVGAWSPGLGQSGLVLRDWSGNGNNGTLTNGPTWGVSGGRQALSFDGVDDYVAIGTPSKLTGNSEGGLSTWIKFNAINKFQVIIGKGSFSTGFEWRIRSDNTMQWLSPEGTAVSYNAIGSTVLSANTLYHLAVLFKTGYCAGYVNGKIDFTSTYGSNSNPLSIALGHRPSESNLFLDASVFELQWFNALNSSQIRLLATRPGIAYELAPRKSYFLPPSPSSQFYDVLSPSIFAGSI